MTARTDNPHHSAGATGHPHRAADHRRAHTHRLNVAAEYRSAGSTPSFCGVKRRISGEGEDVTAEVTP